MVRTRIAIACLVMLIAAAIAEAQTGQGSLRGYIKDEQGGALPGVTVTATSPALIQPTTATTDAEGYYRLINLPPGTYVIKAELTGFAPYRREDVLLRAGANFQVDVTMKIGSLQETVTVAGESPSSSATCRFRRAETGAISWRLRRASTRGHSTTAAAAWCISVTAPSTSPM